MKSSRISCSLGKRDKALFFLLLGALVLVSAGASLCLGAARISPGELLRALFSGQEGSTARRIVLYSRLPRTCAALLAGAGMAVSGVVIQSVLGNPLAAPSTIGVNSGAGLAAAVCCAAAPTAPQFVPVAAFFGALLGAVLVLFLSERTGASRITLILAGVAVSNIFSAGIDAVITLFPDALTGYSDFRIGGLSGVTMERIWPSFWAIGLCMLALFLLSNELDVLSLGRETAQSVGLSTRPLRLVFLALAAAQTGAVVSFAGLLGFVGLIVPHGMRRLVGEEARFLLPASALGGAAFLSLCDTLSRTLFAPYQIPVGIVLSLLGGPFFIWLLLWQRKGRIHD